MTPEQTKRFKYWQMRTIIATMVGYALFYFVRKNFSLAMPGLEADLGISKTSLGIFLTLNGLIYGFSRFANGILADRMNARWYMAIGLALCALANFAFGFGEDVSYWITGQHDGSQFTNTMILFMGIMWVINGMLQGTGFPPCARLLTHWIPPTELATKMSVWNTSHSIGAGLVVILCGYIMGTVGMNMTADPDAVATIPRRCCGHGARDDLRGACRGVEMVFLGTFGHRIRRGDRIGRLPARYALFGRASRTGRHRGEGGEEGDEECRAPRIPDEARVQEPADLDPGLRQFLRIYRPFLGARLGAFAAEPVEGRQHVACRVARGDVRNRRYRRHVVCRLGYGQMAQGPCAPHLRLLHGGRRALRLRLLATADAPVWLLFLTLCAAGFCIYGPQALIGIAAANQATKKAAATANGLTGLFGYASTVVSGVGLGFVAQHYGWNWAYVGIIGVAVVGMLVFLMMWGARADGYDAEPERN